MSIDESINSFQGISGLMAAEAPREMTKRMEPEDIMSILRNRRNDLARKVTDLDAAINALNDNPEFVSLFDLLAKVRRY